MYRIIVADDEPIERMVVDKIINRHFAGQLQVVSAVNGREAVELYEKEACCMALLDIEMPGINGLEAAEIIRKKDKNAGIVFLTAFDEFSYAKRAIGVKALDYLLKPVAVDELVDVLEEAIRLAQEQEETAGQAKEQEEMAGQSKGQDEMAGQSKEQEETAGQAKEQEETAGQAKGQDEMARQANGQDEAGGMALVHGESINGPNSPEEGESGLHKTREGHEFISDNLRMNAVAESIRIYIETHYMEEIALQDVAAAMNYSDAYFCKLFKQCFDKSFVSYLTLFRIEKAKELLSDVLVNVKDIGAEVGYKDSNYFTKVFKRLEGVTPTEYRKQILQNTEEK